MEKVWETTSEAYLHFSQALAIMESRIEEMGGHVENLEELSLGPEACIRATVSLYFTGPELREYISRLPPHVSNNDQG
jgi:hypothetical protein